jgi:tetratricopeptide (TPR) repeat protein
MGRKKSGNGAEGSLTFSDLLRWHMDRGTRPGGSPEVEGIAWTVKEFAAAARTTERSLGSWRNGGHPEDLRPVENALFGKEGDSKYLKFRDDLRRAYRLTRSGGSNTVLGPQSTIHDPGLCEGRDDEIVNIVGSLVSVRSGASILVLGDAGHGKTTLTEKVGVHPDVLRQFSERRWFVELERADTAESALAEIAEAIGLERTAPLPAVQARFATKQGLVVLDNLETPLHADGRATETLLRDLISVPGLALMASLRSRETVGGVPWTDQIWLEPLRPDVARTVFRSIAPNIRENDPGLDYFLNELDGIPLAIRLVATRASTRRNLGDLRREWERKGALIAVEPGGKGTRRDSLVASVEFSLASQRLRKPGKRLFSFLGQLPAGLAIEDLNALLREAGDDAADQLRQVGLLRDGDGRIGLLSPIRDIAHRRHSPDSAMMNAWIAHYLSLATQEGDRIGKEGGNEAITRLVPEMANIDAAMSASANEPELRSSAVTALEGFGMAMRYTGISGGVALDKLSAAYRSEADCIGQAKCMIVRASLARMRSMNEVARADYSEARRLIDGFGEDELEANCVSGLANVARRQDDNEAARALYVEARAFYQRAGSLIGEADCIWGLAEIARMQDDSETARGLHAEARVLYQRAGSLIGEADCIWGLAGIAELQSDSKTARGLYVEARAFYQRTGSLSGEANCIRGLAEIARMQDDKTERGLYVEARALYQRTSSLSGEAYCICGLAEIARMQADNEAARGLYVEARTLFQRTGSLNGEANCIRGLAEIARQLSDNETARGLYAEARTFYQRAGSFSGEADCIWGLAEIARQLSDTGAARGLYVEARAFYQRAGLLSAEADCIWGLAEIARMLSDTEAARGLYVEARELYARANRSRNVISCDARILSLR